jgi:hypothetical protein
MVVAVPTDTPPERSSPPKPGGRRDAPRRMLGVGATILLGSVAVMLLPLLWGTWSVNRYLVAFGFAGACLGVSLVLNGAWDWLARRRGRGPG